MPPQRVWPQTMMSWILRWTTPYSRMAEMLTSLKATMLATLRCTNIVPGFEPVIWCSLTRESEQPIQSTCGVCLAAIDR